jgi:hypothetical protein
MWVTKVQKLKHDMMLAYLIFVESFDKFFQLALLFRAFEIRNTLLDNSVVVRNWSWGCKSTLLPKNFSLYCTYV